MTQFATPGIGLNAGYPEGHDGWKAGADYNFVMSSAFLRRIVANRTTGTLPGSPAIGDTFIAGGTLTGALIGKKDWLVVRGETTWYYLAPENGWKFFDAAVGYWVEYHSATTEWIATEVDVTAAKNIQFTTDFGVADLGALFWATSGIAVVDMNFLDYTMTDSEAICPVKAIINAAPGKKLTWPTTSDSRIAMRQVVILAYAGSDGLIFKQQTGGFELPVPNKNSLVQLSLIPGALFFETTRDATVVDVTAATYTIYGKDVGTTFRFDHATGVAVEFDGTCGYSGFWVGAMQGGAGQITYASTALGIENIDGHTKSEGQWAKNIIEAGPGNEMVLSGRTGV